MEKMNLPLIFTIDAPPTMHVRWNRGVKGGSKEESECKGWTTPASNPSDVFAIATVIAS